MAKMLSVSKAEATPEWTVTGLPSGLYLSPSNGIGYNPMITGTPLYDPNIVYPETFDIIVTVTDNFYIPNCYTRPDEVKPFTITINPKQPAWFAEGTENGEATAVATDSSGNVKYADIGLFLKGKLNEHFKKIETPVSIKYIDPSYNIRSCQANARDSILCLMLGENAVHAAMAGKTDMFIGFWNQNFTHVPFTAAIGKRKKIDLKSQFWQTIKAVTE